MWAHGHQRIESHTCYEISKLFANGRFVSQLKDFEVKGICLHFWQKCIGGNFHEFQKLIGQMSCAMKCSSCRLISHVVGKSKVQ